MKFSLFSTIAASTLHGCVPPAACPSFSTPFGSIKNLTLEYFTRFVLTGKINCADESRGPSAFEFVPFEPQCPIPNSADSYALATKITEECVDKFLVDASVAARVATDWVGSALVVRPLDRLVKHPEDIIATCGDKNDTLVILPSFWGIDLRSVPGNKFIQLLPSVVEIDGIPATEDPDLVAVLQPIDEFISKFSSMKILNETLILSRGPEALESVTVTTDYGRFVRLEFFPVTQESRIVIVRKRLFDLPPLVEPPRECVACIENAGLNKNCMKDTRNACGVVVDPVCDDEKERMIMHCAASCANDKA